MHHCLSFCPSMTNPKYKNAIFDRIHDVVLKTHNLTRILELLSQDLNEGEIQKINSRQNGYDQATYFYNIILKKDDQIVFDKLLQSLEKSGNDVVRSVILGNLRIVEASNCQDYFQDLPDSSGATHKKAINSTESNSDTAKYNEVLVSDDDIDDEICRNFKQIAINSDTFKGLPSGCEKLTKPIDFSEMKPNHVDFSSSSINDDSVFKIGQLIEKTTIHILILSNNEITKTGFLYLLRLIPTTLKYLMLDRNHIHLDQPRFNSIFNPQHNCLLNERPNLKILDLSYNFITKRWIKKLKELYPTELISIQNIHYININNCRVIYQRKEIGSCRNKNKFRPCCMKATKVWEETEFIAENRGLVAWVEAKKIPLINYSTHVMIIIEMIDEGQRELYTAELLVKDINDCCTIRLSNSADPFEKTHIEGGKEIRSVLARLEEDFEIPRPGFVKNASIQCLLEKIKEERNIAGTKIYSVMHRNNCYQFAKEMLRGIDIDMPEIAIPVTYKLYNSTRNNLDLLFATLIILLIGVATYKFLY